MRSNGNLQLRLAVVFAFLATISCAFGEENTPADQPSCPDGYALAPKQLSPCNILCKRVNSTVLPTPGSNTIGCNGGRGSRGGSRRRSNGGGNYNRGGYNNGGGHHRSNGGCNNGGCNRGCYDDCCYRGSGCSGCGRVCGAAPNPSIESNLNVSSKRSPRYQVIPLEDGTPCQIYRLRPHLHTVNGTCSTVSRNGQSISMCDTNL